MPEVESQEADYNEIRNLPAEGVRVQLSIAKRRVEMLEARLVTLENPASSGSLTRESPPRSQLRAPLGDVASPGCVSAVGALKLSADRAPLLSSDGADADESAGVESAGAGDGAAGRDAAGGSGGGAGEVQQEKMRKTGVRHRRGRQEKGGRRAADCFEESLWDPKVVMPALGIRPVGHISTCFPRRNGCPRQGSVCPESRARLDLVFGSNAHHATAGLEDFSHVWLIFLFDGNGMNYTPRPSVCPPRLNGKTKGVFATRAPHRPCPIGLSLCKLDEVKGRSLLLSGVDLVDGTPILDIKPYIPCYDVPFANGPDGSEDRGAELCAKLGGEGKDLRYPDWCVPPARKIIEVIISPEAEKQLLQYEEEGVELRALPDWTAVRTAMKQVLQADPRSVYRKESCVGQVYPFYLDCLDITTTFDDAAGSALVVAVSVVSRDAQRDAKAGTAAAPPP